MSSAGYEKLMIYGFSLDYPTSCKLEFNPKFERKEGDVAIKWPTGEHIFVSWGPLEKIKNKVGNAEVHANFTLEKIKKNQRAKVTRLEHTLRGVNGHDSIYDHVKLEIPSPGLFGGKPQFQEIRSFHLHCDRTSRYFLIYESTLPERAGERQDAIERVVASFACH